MVQPWESNLRPIAGLHMMPQHLISVVKKKSVFLPWELENFY